MRSRGHAASRLAASNAATSTASICTPATSISAATVSAGEQRRLAERAARLRLGGIAGDGDRRRRPRLTFRPRPQTTISSAFPRPATTPMTRTFSAADRPASRPGHARSTCGERWHSRSPPTWPALVPTSDRHGHDDQVSGTFTVENRGGANAAAFDVDVVRYLQQSLRPVRCRTGRSRASDEAYRRAARRRATTITCQTSRRVRPTRPVYLGLRMFQPANHRGELA